MIHSRILGTGGYLPERVLTNRELEQIVETSDQWIRERTGIRERRIVAPDQSCGDLALIAGQRALEAAGIGAGEVDLLVVATCTPDHVFPSTASVLQARLGLKPGGAAFDVAAACSGFLYGLDLAHRFIRTEGARTAMVIGAETMSRILNWSDRGTCVIFGDGAGAVILQAADEPGVLSTHVHADGRYQDLLGVRWGVGAGEDAVDRTIHMRGNEVFKVAVRTLGQMVDDTLAANGMDKGDVDWLVPHQANIRIIQATARKLGLSMERVIQTVACHGNTSSASVPLALDTGIRDGRIQRGHVVLLEAFGGGFTWGSALVRY